MKNNDVAEIWGNGFVTVRKLNDVTDVGRYLTAYLADMSISDMDKLPTDIKADKLKIIDTNEDGTKKSKAIIKGARMALYPAGFHLYRISKGIKKPIVSQMLNNEAMGIVANSELMYESTVICTDETRGFENTVNKRFYNKLGGGMKYGANKHK